MRRRVVVVAAMAVALAFTAIALASDEGHTTTVDRPSGALPFDGAGAAAIGGYRAISDDGRYVVFESAADGLLGPSGDHPGNGIYRFDRTNGDVVLVSRKDDDTPMTGTVHDASVSGDGSKVAFSTTIAADPADTNAKEDIYVRDVAAGTTTLVSCVMGPGCTVADEDSEQPSISGDGSTVAWETAGDLTDNTINDTDGRQDIYARQSSKTDLVSVNDDDTADNNAASFASSADVNNDGTKIAFVTESHLGTAVASNDANGIQDVYVRTEFGSPNASTYLASRTATGTAVRGTDPSISSNANGALAFVTVADQGTDNDGDGDIYVQPNVTGMAALQLISAADGTVDGDANGQSSEPSISGDGTAVAFGTSASNLVAGDEGPQRDILLRTGTTTTLLTRADGANGPKSTVGSSRPSISRDGTVTAFSTFAPLDPSDLDLSDVYLRAGTTTQWASKPIGGPTTPRADSARLGNGPGPKVTPDGRYVVFESSSPALTGYADGRTGVFRRDMTTGAIVRADVTVGGVQQDGSASQPSISADGTRVAFGSAATNLVNGDANGKADVFVRDIAAATTTLATTDAAGTFSPRISANGARLAFTTAAALVNADDNGVFDVYVRTLPEGNFLLASRAGGADGAVAVNGGTDPSISDDGTRVAFYSASANLPDTDGNGDVFVRDLAAGTTAVASRTASGGQPDAPPSESAISGDGTRVAWTTAATNLGDGDTDAQDDLHVRTLANATVEWASRGVANGVLTAGAVRPLLSANGALAMFTSQATNGDAAESSGDQDAFLRDLTAGTTSLAAKTDAGASPAGDVVDAAMNADGGCIAFTTAAPGVDPNGYPSTDFTHVYLFARSGTCPRPAPTPTATATATTTATPTATPTVTPEPDTTAPRFTKARARVFKKNKVIITFKISEAANITLKVSLCKRRCAKLVKTVTLTRKTTKAKRVKIVLRGKAGKRKLRKRHFYQLQLQATDAAGNPSSPLRQTIFIKPGFKT